MFLEFLYCNELDAEWETAIEMIKIADIYSIPGLRALCCDIITRGLTVDNVVEIANMAEARRLNDLKDETIDFILKFRSDIVEYNGLVGLSKALLIETFMKPK